MTIHEKTATLIARGVGVGLIIMGITSALYFPFFDDWGGTTAGWTSYSPLTTATDPNVVTTTTSVTTFWQSASWYLPGAVQAFAGLILIFFSRPIGCWLALGLDRPEEGEG